LTDRFHWYITYCWFCSETAKKTAQYSRYCAAQCGLYQIQLVFRFHTYFHTWDPDWLHVYTYHMIITPDLDSGRLTRVTLRLTSLRVGKKTAAHWFTFRFRFILATIKIKDQSDIHITYDEIASDTATCRFTRKRPGFVWRFYSQDFFRVYICTRGYRLVRVSRLIPDRDSPLHC
jgi:hypothetical protein